MLRLPLGRGGGGTETPLPIFLLSNASPAMSPLELPRPCRRAVALRHVEWAATDGARMIGATWREKWRGARCGSARVCNHVKVKEQEGATAAPVSLADQ